MDSSNITDKQFIRIICNRIANGHFKSHHLYPFFPHLSTIIYSSFYEFIPWLNLGRPFYNRSKLGPKFGTQIFPTLFQHFPDYHTILPYYGFQTQVVSYSNEYHNEFSSNAQTTMNDNTRTDSTDSSLKHEPLVITASSPQFPLKLDCSDSASQHIALQPTQLSLAQKYELTRSTFTQLFTADNQRIELPPRSWYSGRWYSLEEIIILLQKAQTATIYIEMRYINLPYYHQMCITHGKYDILEILTECIQLQKQRVEKSTFDSSSAIPSIPSISALPSQQSINYTLTPENPLFLPFPIEFVYILMHPYHSFYNPETVSPILHNYYSVDQSTPQSRYIKSTTQHFPQYLIAPNQRMVPNGGESSPLSVLTAKFEPNAIPSSTTLQPETSTSSLYSSADSAQSSIHHFHQTFNTIAYPYLYSPMTTTTILTDYLHTGHSWQRLRTCMDFTFMPFLHNFCFMRDASKHFLLSHDLTSLQSSSHPELFQHICKEVTVYSPLRATIPAAIQCTESILLNIQESLPQQSTIKEPTTATSTTATSTTTTTTTSTTTTTTTTTEPHPLFPHQLSLPSTNPNINLNYSQPSKFQASTHSYPETIHVIKKKIGKTSTLELLDIASLGQQDIDTNAEQHNDVTIVHTKSLYTPAVVDDSSVNYLPNIPISPPLSTFSPSFHPFSNQSTSFNEANSKFKPQSIQDQQTPAIFSTPPSNSSPHSTNSKPPQNINSHQPVSNFFTYIDQTSCLAQHATKLCKCAIQQPQSSDLATFSTTSHQSYIKQQQLCKRTSATLSFIAFYCAIFRIPLIKRFSHSQLSSQCQPSPDCEPSFSPQIDQPNTTLYFDVQSILLHTHTYRHTIHTSSHPYLTPYNQVKQPSTYHDNGHVDYTLGLDPPHSQIISPPVNISKPLFEYVYLTIHDSALLIDDLMNILFASPVNRTEVLMRHDDDDDVNHSQLSNCNPTHGIATSTNQPPTQTIIDFSTTTSLSFDESHPDRNHHVGDHIQDQNDHFSRQSNQQSSHQSCYNIAGCSCLYTIVIDCISLLLSADLFMIHQPNLTTALIPTDGNTSRHRTKVSSTKMTNKSTRSPPEPPQRKQYSANPSARNHPTNLEYMLIVCIFSSQISYQQTMLSSTLSHCLFHLLNQSPQTSPASSIVSQTSPKSSTINASSIQNASATPATSATAAAPVTSATSATSSSSLQSSSSSSSPSPLFHNQQFNYAEHLLNKTTLFFFLQLLVTITTYPVVFNAAIATNANIGTIIPHSQLLQFDAPNISRG